MVLSVVLRAMSIRDTKDITWQTNKFRLMVSRRTLLGASVAGAMGLAGCTTLKRATETLGDLQRESPKRRVPMGWTPDSGTWPQPRYDPGHTRQTNANPPSTSPDILWQNEFESTIKSLLVAEGTVFITTREKILGLDANDGSQLWSRPLDARTALKYVDGRLYELRLRGLTARSPGGTRIWERSFETVLYDALDRNGYVFVTHGDEGYSTLHADTGDVVRRRNSAMGFFAVNDYDVIATRLSAVVSLDLKGRTLGTEWETELTGPYEPYGFPVISDGRIYVKERGISGGDKPDGRVSILTDSGDDIETLHFDEVPVGLAVSGDHLVVGTSTITAGSLGAQGGLQVFDTQGNPLWTYDPNAGTAPLAVSHGRIYVGPAFHGTIPLVALDSTNGDVLWKRPISDALSFAVVDQTMFTGQGPRLIVYQ